MFIKGRDLLFIDPFNDKITLRKYIPSISKLSYDLNSNHETYEWHLFRLVYNNQDVQILLAKDRNEIVNAIVSRQRKIAVQELKEKELNELRERGENIPLGFDNFERFRYQKYKPNIRSGMYEFQVFGVDVKNQLYPHSLALFSHFIRHVDSKSKRIFSQHSYIDAQEIICNGDKITIKYENDNPYTCIVSHNDKTEIVGLIRGRMYIYRMILNPSKLEEEESSIIEPKIEQPKSSYYKESSFPGVFTVSNEEDANFSNPAVRTFDSSHAPVTTATSELSDEEDNEDEIESIEFVNNGSPLLKFYKNYLKKPNIHQRFCKLDSDGIFHYGKTRHGRMKSGNL